MKKIIAGIMALCLCGGAFLPQVTAKKAAPRTTAVAEDEVNYTKVTQGVFICHKYEDHVEIAGCLPETVGEITVPKQIEGLPVTKIIQGAFSLCEEITAITLPESIEKIGIGAFAMCGSLQKFNVDEDSKSFCTVDGILFNKDKTTLVNYPGGKKGEKYTIPDTVKIVESGAIAFNPHIKEIYAPKSVKSLGIGAFGCCPKLAAVTLENPDCVFSPAYNQSVISNEYTNDTFKYSGIIYGKNDSTAQKYAEKYEYKFISTDSEAPTEKPIQDPTADPFIDDMPDWMETLKKGDANGDGIIDASDASLVLMEYAAVSTGQLSVLENKQQNAADVNSDGIVDSSDASQILVMYAIASTGGENIN